MESKAGRNLFHTLTLISIGIMAYVFADIFHEAIGHGLTSLLLRNKITLLTSVYFRSEPHSYVTDFFGPILNLVAGFIIWIILKHINISTFYLLLLLIVTMAFNFFWFSWMCLYCGVANQGDFAFYISEETEAIAWRIFLILTGLLSYFLTFKLVAKVSDFQSLPNHIKLRQLFSIPYLSAGISALFAVSFHKPLSFDNFYEAFVFPMFLPTLFLARQTETRKRTDEEYSFGQQRNLILAGLSLFILFCLTMGLGIKA